MPTGTPSTPIPVPVGTADVMLLGGTFDPPHLAHVELARRARQAVCPGAQLVFIPAARSPHKTAGPVASDEDRVRMVELAIEDLPRSGVWRVEIDRAGAGQASYTIDTVREARRQLGDHAHLWLIIGADQAAAFSRWRKPREIMALARVVVLLREPWGSPGALIEAMAADGFWADDELEAWRTGIVEVGLMDASATAVRAGEAPDQVPGLVREYILRHGLYGAGR